MNRQINLIQPGNTFVFNSEDTVNHPWGDFVMNHRNPFTLEIDGRVLEIVSYGDWTFFHRDEEGIIDHIVPLKSYGDPEICPCCGKQIRVL